MDRKELESSRSSLGLHPYLMTQRLSGNRNALSHHSQPSIICHLQKHSQGPKASHSEMSTCGAHYAVSEGLCSEIQC